MVLSFVALALGVTVTQYDGPTECEKKIETTNRIYFHYVGTIDESSAVGEAGKQFDTSRQRHKPVRCSDWRFAASATGLA